MAETMDPDSLIVGVDIGGTKTHLRALGPGGFRRDRIVPSRDWRRRRWQDDARLLVEMTAELVNRAPVGAIGVGAHGCDDTAECRAFQDSMAAETPVPVAVVNDAELMPLAIDLPGQIGVVAGTGSIAVHRNPQGELVVAGGWGWIIGDEGSAAGLMREAVKAVALHLDREGDAGDPLVRGLFATLGIRSAARLGSTLAQLSSAAVVGEHASTIFDAADQGSPLAQRVITEGGRALADLVGRLLDRGVSATHAVAGGGVIVKQPLLWQAFADSLSERSGGRVTPVLFAGKPVEGAVKLARATLQFPAAQTCAASQTL